MSSFYPVGDYSHNIITTSLVLNPSEPYINVVTMHPTHNNAAMRLYNNALTFHVLVLISLNKGVLLICQEGGFLAKWVQRLFVLQWNIRALCTTHHTYRAASNCLPSSLCTRPSVRMLSSFPLTVPNRQRIKLHISPIVYNRPPPHLGHKKRRRVQSINYQVSMPAGGCFTYTLYIAQQIVLKC